MTNPYIPLTAWTGSFSVQNQKDVDGSLQTYFAAWIGRDAQIKFAGIHPMVTFKVPREIIAALTASLSAAYASTATGSF